MTGRPACALGRRRGFSLLEIVVVVATISFLGIIVGIVSVAVLRDTENRSAEGNAQAVLLAQQRLATRYGSYSSYPNDLSDVPAVTVVNAVSDGPDQVAVAVGTRGTLGIAVRRDGRECILIQATSLAGGGNVERVDSAQTTCSAVDALPSGEGEDTARQLVSVSNRAAD